VKDGNYFNVIRIKGNVRGLFNSDKLSFNDIVPLEEIDEINMIAKWKQPTDFNQKKVVEREPNEICFYGFTEANPPITLMKKLSTNSEIEEIILSYTDKTLKNGSGVLLIRKGGIFSNTKFERETEENELFSRKLIESLDYKSNSLQLENILNV